MQKMYDKEKLMNLHFDKMKEYEELRHKNIMKEIEAMGKNKVSVFSRDTVKVKTKKKR